jgi:trehalose 6-phosphate phosphatase
MKTKTRIGPVYFFGSDASDIVSVLGGRKIALFLDFDGTLTPIQDDPTRCFLSEEGRELLQSIANSGRHHVTVLSGRTLDDVRARVGVHNICYGGNHGLVISGKGMRFIHPGVLRAKPLIDEAGSRLEQKIAPFAGAWVERKGFTLSLHYRLVNQNTVRQLKRAFYKVAAEISRGSLLTVMKGKKVLELMPGIPWTKGNAVLWILHRLGDGYMPIFVGDDVTDEAAFKALENGGITIRIGWSKKTSAHFFLQNYQGTLRLLKTIQTI